jgi:hypothetical protein
MFKRNQKRYAPPCILQAAQVMTERNLLVGSTEIGVRTAGQIIDAFYEVEYPESTFNTMWD